MKQAKQFWIDLMRWIGGLVCQVRGHRHFYPGGEVRSWAAYSCIRCGKLDRPLESLPYRPDDEEFDMPDADYQEEIERQHEIERRWFSRLPFPRWI